MSATVAGRVRRTRRYLVVLGSLAAAIPLLSRPVAAGGTGVYEYVAVRTTTAASSLEVQIGLAEGLGTYSPAFLGAIGATVEHDHVTAVQPGFNEHYNGRPDPLVAAQGMALSACTAGICHVDGTATSGDVVAYQDSGGPGVMNRLYLVVEGPKPKLTVTATGWELHPAHFAYRSIDGSGTADAAVYAEQMGVEVFRSATLSGGAHGSIAQGAPPCSGGGPGGGVPVQVGVGQVSLAGGRLSPSVMWPATSSTYVADSADGPTQWNLSGVVVGNATVQEVRLFVVDLAAPADTPSPLVSPAAAPANPGAPPSSGAMVANSAAAPAVTSNAAIGLPMTSPPSPGVAVTAVAALSLVCAVVAVRRRRSSDIDC